ncbi:MAG: site-specific integrase [Sedimentisphaerales bacterium]
MVLRVCRELGNKKNIIVINDEAHHCYHHKPDGEELKLKGDDRKEADQREKDARVCINGLESVKSKMGIKAIYDLSATPFFLRGSVYSEGTLFPWVVSDFSLIDAIECGIVKVPRVPVSDDSMTGDQPTYRDLWLRIRERLPKKGRKKEAVTGEPKLPVVLEGALRSLYGNYEKHYKQWKQDKEVQEKGGTPPVFIVVYNNTNVSKLVFDWIAGWDKTLSKETTIPVKDHEARTISLPEHTLGILEDLRTYYAATDEETPYVLLNQKQYETAVKKLQKYVQQKRAWRNQDMINNTLRSFERQLKRAKIKPKGTLSIHTLRKSCIQNWANFNPNPKVTQRLAGHADLKTTMQFYCTVTKVEREQAAQAVDTLLEKADV